MGYFGGKIMQYNRQKEEREKKNDKHSRQYIFEKEVYNRIILLIRKDTDILHRVEAAQKVNKMSRNALILLAIQEFLERHGF